MNPARWSSSAKSFAAVGVLPLASPDCHAILSSPMELIAATVAHGPFLALGVSHAAASANDVSFSGTLVFQLFDDLTSNTVSQIEQFVADDLMDEIRQEMDRLRKGSKK